MITDVNIDGLKSFNIHNFARNLMISDDCSEYENSQ